MRFAGPCPLSGAFRKVSDGTLEQVSPQREPRCWHHTRVGDVTALRYAGEMKSYIDLLFLALVILLCVVKIVTN